MNLAKHLGIFVRTPVPGTVKSRLAPSIGAEGACALYRAFLKDLFRRLYRLKSTRVTVFYAGDDPGLLRPLLPRGWALEPQTGDDLGARLAAASTLLLSSGGRALIMGSDSPDLPVQYIRRAFQRLKHKDVTLGPATDGGYYLVGLRAPAPALFENVRWGSHTVMAETVENVRAARLTLHVLPMWYDVDTEASLGLLRTMLAARRVEGRDRLIATEAALEHLDNNG